MTKLNKCIILFIVLTSIKVGGAVLDLSFLRGKARHRILMLFDLFIFAFVNLACYLLFKYDSFKSPIDNSDFYLANAILLGVFLFPLRNFVFGIYRNIWRYAGTSAYFRFVLSDLIAGVASMLVSRIITQFVPRFYISIWYSITITALTTLASLAARFAYRMIYKHLNISNPYFIEKVKVRIPVAIIGAGQLGAYLAGELKNSPKSKYKPVCFFDIDNTKIKNNISGLPVYDAKDAEKVITDREIGEVIIAINKINSEQLDYLWNRYSSLGCSVKIYDAPLSDEKGGKVKIRNFEIEDLLFRQPLTIGSTDSADFYKDKTVLITGGGGSIGSELCRQTAKLGPRKIIIFDIYENNAYEIEQSMKTLYEGTLDLVVEIGSVRDKQRLEGVFQKHRPDIVFHAAAHKHVPLMEHSACEAVKNNVFGTLNTVDMAEKYGVTKFILISTDKAVNPTNIMGASKRLCEMIVQSRSDSKTSFSAVRFGNVLGSNGSVIPLFREQIAHGGPVTITDKRIIRYFMTISEASQLVMQAGAMAKQGELFVLDMGKPVKIYDLAVNMIRLSGYEPDKDIEIKEIGLRPGEKLYEELLMKSDTLYKTKNDMIFIEKDAPHTRKDVEDKMTALKAALENEQSQVDSTIIKTTMLEVVPTYKEPSEFNENAQESEEMKLAATV